MFFSTMLTLVLVPVVYALMSRFTRMRTRDDEAAGAGEMAATTGTGGAAAEPAAAGL
jgi:hypothetical protein